VAEKGNHRRIPPIRITAAKLSTKIRVGGRRLENKVLILRKILLGIRSSKNESITRKA
jgi:hypothetical protein